MNKEKQTKKQVKSSNKKKNTKKKNLKLRRIIVFVFIVIVLIGIIALILFSDLFKIKKFTVIHNSKVNSEVIIKDSKLVIGNGMFKVSKRAIKDSVKSNPYIENVKIKKHLNGEIVLDVEERVASFMLKNDNEYIYINNQGYILEKNSEVIQVPIIIGYSTTNFEPGNRLDVQDLKKMDQVIQIMENARSHGLNDKIYSIDISNSSNYILEIPSETKKVQFGDNSNINVKMLWIMELIEKEKGIDGEIVLSVPNIKKVYFRERV